MVTIGTDLEVGPPGTCPDLPDLRPLLGGVRQGRIRPTLLQQSPAMPLV
jgi:hypothetical protein